MSHVLCYVSTDDAWQDALRHSSPKPRFQGFRVSGLKLKPVYAEAS